MGGVKTSTSLTARDEFDFLKSDREFLGLPHPAILPYHP
jgi:hypothetical protein